MAKQHRDKLIPTLKSTGVPFRLGLMDSFFKLRSRKNLEQLIQNAAKSFHGADSSFDRKAWSFCRSYTEVQPRFWSLLKNLIWTPQPVPGGEAVAAKPSELRYLYPKCEKRLRFVSNRRPADGAAALIFIEFSRRR